MRIVILLFTCFILVSEVTAREFDCEVRVDNNQVESGRSSVFDDMEDELENFINNQSWTGLEVDQSERLQCNFTITITSWDRDNESFEAKVQVQSARPVYNSGYNTTLVNHLDEQVEFEFGPTHRLEYVEGSHFSEISSVIAFYLYFMLGMDLDSFSPEGGEQFFDQARNVASSAQTSDKPGWQPFDSERNRHGLAHHVLESRYAPFREAIYIYHRKGLDKMSDDPEAGRQQIHEALKTLRALHRSRPNAYLLRMFFRSKSTEIINAFSQATASERRDVLDLLQTMDPQNSSEYRRRLR